MNTGKIKQPTTLVIIGITGDLARRKLLPAIERIAAAGQLPADFTIIGISRRPVTLDEVFAPLPRHAAEPYAFMRQHLHMYQMNLERPEDYEELRIKLHTAHPDGQVLFYLSVPPQIAQPIIEHLGNAGFGAGDHTKLLLEKPFGSDLGTAGELIDHIHRHFAERHVYRIDHYLAKEMAQNLLIFRSGNSLFKRTWNRDFIERIEIIGTESIGIEGRATFYEQTGALRDIVQSHLLQLAALTLMDLPPNSEFSAVPAARLAALQALEPASPDQARRGQYHGYRQEVQNGHSATETFVSLGLHSSAPRWQGVPITITAGKALDATHTEIHLYYRQEDAGEANRLTLRIQPREGIELSLWSKRPGYSRELECVQLRFNYHEQGQLSEAYEQVLLDAIAGNHTLFTSGDEVLAAWRILAPVQAAWASNDAGLITYRPGSSPESVH
jgi:glucose-6-phosphate 1-dehydrogenase